MDMVIDSALPGLTCSPDTSELVKALVAAQAAYPAIEKTGENKFGKYWYLTYSGICEALRGPLNANGLSLPQVCLTRVGGEWIAVGTLRHSSGQFVTSLCPLYLGVDKGGQPKLDMQSLGSAYTYAKKYLLLGLVGGWAEEDDDGQQTMPQRQEQRPVRNQVRGMEIESKARAAIDAAASGEEIASVLKRVELRVAERVCDQAVLDRLTKYSEEMTRGEPERLDGDGQPDEGRRAEGSRRDGGGVVRNRGQRSEGRGDVPQLRPVATGQGD
jgi:hypothetical protein